MGFSGISPWSLLLILVIVALIFGTKRLRNMGGDIGKAYKGFKQAVNSNENESDEKKNNNQDT